MNILNIILGILTFGTAVVELIAEKGDDAGDIRLRDIEGYEDLRAESLQDEARSEFLKKYREQFGG